MITYFFVCMYAFESHAFQKIDCRDTILEFRVGFVWTIKVCCLAQLHYQDTLVRKRVVE